jgi:hypothetical protein
LSCASSFGAPPELVGCSCALQLFELLKIGCYCALHLFELWLKSLVIDVHFISLGVLEIVVYCHVRQMSELLTFLAAKLSFFQSLNLFANFFFNNPICCIYLLCHLNMGDAQISKVVIISCFVFIIKLLQQIIIEENSNSFPISDTVH